MEPDICGVAPGARAARFLVAVPKPGRVFFAVMVNEQERRTGKKTLTRPVHDGGRSGLVFIKLMDIAKCIEDNEIGVGGLCCNERVWLGLHRRKPRNANVSIGINQE